MGKWRDCTSHWTHRVDAGEIAKRVVATKVARGTLRGRPRVPIDVDEAARLYSQGLSVHEIGATLGTNGTRIWKRLNEAGISMRSRGLGRDVPNLKKRKHPELFDEVWLREQYLTKSSTEIGRVIEVSGPQVCVALKRFGIQTTFNKHQSRIHKTSPRAAAQRREKLGRHPSKLQRMLGLVLYRLGFADIRHEEPFGAFCADWYSPSLRLAFEADGSWHRMPGHVERDAERDGILAERHGVAVARFGTTDIRRLCGEVCPCPLG